MKSLGAFQVGFILMLLPLVAAGAFSDADVQKLGQTILSSVDGPQFTDADRFFVIGRLVKVERPGLNDLYKEARYRLERLRPPIAGRFATPESVRSNHENGINREPQETQPPLPEAQSQVAPVPEFNEEETAECSPLFGASDNSCTLLPYTKLRMLIRQRKELSEEAWERELSWTIRNLQAEPLTLDGLRFRLSCISLLSDVNPKEALVALRAVYTDNYQIWGGGVIFALSTMPDSNIVVGHRISVEGLDGFLRARFHEVDSGFAKLVRGDSRAVGDLIDEIANPYFQLVLRLRLFLSLTADRSVGS